MSFESKAYIVSSHLIWSAKEASDSVGFLCASPCVIPGKRETRWVFFIPRTNGGIEWWGWIGDSLLITHDNTRQKDVNWIIWLLQELLLPSWVNATHEVSALWVMLNQCGDVHGLFYSLSLSLLQKQWTREIFCCRREEFFHGFLWAGVTKPTQLRSLIC